MSYIKQNSAAFSDASMHSYDMGLRAYMASVYKYMCFALFVTGFVAYAVSNSPQLMAAIFSSPLQYVVLFAPIAMVMYVSSRFMQMSTQSVKLCLGLYSVLVGVSFSALFSVYTGESLTRVFLISASMFGSMSIYGYTTKKDLTTFFSFFMMGLIGIVVTSLVNIFLQSSALSFITSFVGVGIFSFFTAYDTQRLKAIYRQVAHDPSAADKVALFGALALYLDFINIFISLLHLFGDRK